MSKDQITGGQVAHFIHLTEEHSLDSATIQKLYDSGCLTDLLKSARNCSLPNRTALQNLSGLTPEIFKIIVDYLLTLEEMINLGKYDYKNDHINPINFPIKRESKIDLDTQLIHFNKYISSEDVLKELDKKVLRPATIEEILAFGAQHSEEQRKFPIVALGSSCKFYGYRRVPCLDLGGALRFLDLDFWDGVWNEYYRFLAVAK